MLSRRPFKSRTLSSFRSSAAKSFLLCALPLSLSLSSCTFFDSRPATQGSLIEKPDYDQLKVGETTKQDAIRLLGSPTVHATFNDNVWLYISLVTHPRPLSFPGMNAQDVVVASFDNKGVLEDLRHYNKHQSLRVHMDPHRTPTPGTSISVMEELIGSIGRYNPLAGMGSSFGGLGGLSSGPPGSQGMGGLGSGIGANGSGTGLGGTGNTL